MSLRLGALQDALSDPGNVEKARAAAEEVAGYDRDLTRLHIEVRVSALMIAFNTALLMGLVWLVLRLSEAVARLTPAVP